MTIFKRHKEVKTLIGKIGNYKIKIVVGLRQCGKTYLLNTLFYNKLISNKKYNDVTFRKIDLFSKHRDYISKDSFKLLLNTLKEEGAKLIFIDEVQEAEDYVNTLIHFANDNPSIDIFVTGSNSNTLSNDIARSFKEHADVLCIYPLTYKEILKYKKKYSFDDYLKYGGIPFVVNSRGSKGKIEALKLIYNQVYVLDIIDRLKKANFKYLSETDCNNILKNIFSTTTPFSVVERANNIANRFVPTPDIKLAVGKEIKEYLLILKDSFLICEMDNIDLDGKSPMDKIGIGKKYYSSDCGIAYMLCDDPTHKLAVSLENMMFLYFNYKNIKPSCLLFLGKRNNIDGEIDFVFDNHYVQVTYELNDANYKREVENSLLKIDGGKVRSVMYLNNVATKNDKDIEYVDIIQYLKNNK